jgi:hypothetical protein
MPDVTSHSDQPPAVEPAGDSELVRLRWDLSQAQFELARLRSEAAIAGGVRAELRRLAAVVAEVPGEPADPFEHAVDAAIRLLRAAYGAKQAAHRWSADMDAAPRDGTVVGLTWSSTSARPGYGRWDGQRWVEATEGYSMGTPDRWIGPVSVEELERAGVPVPDCQPRPAP